MTTLRMIALPTKVAELVRATMKSPGYGHPAHKEMAGGYGPCRHCLREFRVGAEERILFTYNPFFELSDYPLPGPVFVHATPCERYAEESTFPEELRKHPLTLVAYGAERSVLQKQYVENGCVEEIAARMLEDGCVQFVHVRDTNAGCYDLRIERGR